MSKITDGFEKKSFIAPGGGRLWLDSDVVSLLSHTLALEAMLKRIEWGTEMLNSAYEISDVEEACPFCYGRISKGHFPDCGLAKLLE